MSRFKVVLHGGSNIGKSHFLKNIIMGDINAACIEPTIGAEVYPLAFKTTKGKFGLDIWDTAGNEDRKGLRDAYVTNADICIFAFSYTSPSSIESAKKEVEHVRRVLGPDFKAVVCGFYAEYKTIITPPADVDSLINGNDWEVFDIDSRDMYNLHIFEGILRKVTDYGDLRFTAKPVRFFL
jgi:small GTP-binding protein